MVLSFLSKNQRDEIVSMLSQAIKDGISELDENKRYLLIVREEEQADETAKLLYDVLGLEDTPNIKLVIVAGNVKLLEY
jgi:hypothetical protein